MPLEGRLKETFNLTYLGLFPLGRSPSGKGMGIKMNKTREKKDVVEKEFVSFPDIAADVINVLLYEGKEIVQADHLRSGPTETIYQGWEILRSQYEDLCKYELSDGKIRLMYLIANQSVTDGKMLLRKAGYVGGIYREQYEEKMQDCFPVIQFVLYWGIPGWKSGRELGKLFGKRNFPEETWKYIDELRLHIFEMRHLPEETRKLFQSDMRIVVDCLAEGNGYRSDRKIKHKAALIKMIKVLSGETDTEDVEKWMEEQGIREEDELTVCELFDQYVRQGRIEGIAAGRTEGIAVGRIEGENRFARLVQELMDGGRNEDLKKAVSDQSYREQLYMEVNLI